MVTRHAKLAGAASLLASVVAPGAGAAADDPGALEVTLLAEMSEVNALAQTPDGFLWIGTALGLYRYDGRTFVRVPHGAPRVEAVHALFVDRDGSLLVATGGGRLGRPVVPGGDFFVSRRRGPAGLWRVSEGRFESVIAEDARPERWIWGFLRDARGDAWLGSEAGVLTVGHGGRVEPERVGGITGIVSALEQDRQGRLWAATVSGLRRRNNGWQPEGPPVPVAILARGPSEESEELWAVTPAGISRRSPNGVTFDEKLPGVQALTFDGEGTAWASTESGLWRHGSKGWALTTERLPVSACQALLVDREGTRWLGCQDGLVRVRVTGVRNHGLADNARGRAVLPTAGGDLWLAATTGLLRWDGVAATPVAELAPGIPVTGITAMAGDGDGGVWFAGHRILHLAPGGTASVVDEPGTIEWEHREVLADRNGGLWISREGEGVVHYPDRNQRATAHEVVPKDGLCTERIAFFHEGPTGTIWAGSRGGLSRIDARGVRCFRRSDGLPAEDVTHAIEDTDGTVWVAMMGSTGLARLRGGKFYGYSDETGLPGGGVFGLLADGDHLWLTSEAGVFRVSRASLLARADTGTAPLSFRKFDVENGMASQHCMLACYPPIARAANGDVWVPTWRGFSVITPVALAESPIADATVDRVSVDGVAVAPRGGAFEVGPDAHTVAIAFTAPSSIAAGHLRFQFSLEREDDRPPTWSAAGAEREAIFAALAPGRYHFAARVAPGIGVEARSNRAAALTFVVRAAFHRTWWFRTVLLALALALVFAVLRLRERRRRDRLAAVHTERVRIARELHDGLAQLFMGVGYHLDALRAKLGTVPAETRALLEQARAQVERADREAHQAVWSLRSSLATSSLRTSLQETVAKAERELGLDIQLSFDGEPPASGVFEHELPRIVQEALTNARKHGEARHATVTLVLGPRELVLRLQDDGKGYAPSDGGGRSDGGFGLLGMRERAAQCGGTLTLLGDETGTTLTVSIPTESQERLRDKSR